MKYVAVAVALAGCGRLGFGETPTGRDAAGPDAAPARWCGDPPTAPDPLLITGTTYRYTNFTNGVAAVPSAVVEADDGATVLASATSDAQGAYTLMVATGGVPRTLALVYAPSGYFTTTVFLDAPLARAVSGTAPPYDWPGDAPVWNGTAMGLVYSSAGATMDPAAGTLNVRVRDCAGMPVDHVQVTITPPPGLMTYLAADGTPDASLTETTPPYDTAFAANAVAGPTTITLSGGGLTWPVVDVTVLGGMNNTLAYVRGEP